MERKYYESIEETIFLKTLDNGLRIALHPKQGFTKSYAVFTTNYGSIDNHFQTMDGVTHHVPDGIAHFLEHKLFEKEDVDVMNTFNELGANTNAFTSFSQTSYLFSTSGDMKEPLRLLLDFVQDPFFSDESVEKEKGIIGEEIDMYSDDPGWRNYFGTIEQMYTAHPVKIDIAGTKETIAEITKEQLYLCYHTFYHPSNMILFVSGDIDVTEIEALIEQNQAQKTFGAPRLKARYYPEELSDVAIKERSISMDVTYPKVMFGFKLTEKMPMYTPIQQEIIYEIILEMLFGKGSLLNERYMKDQIILSPLGFEISIEDSYSHVIVGTDVADKDYFKTMFLQDLSEQIERMTPADFKRILHKSLGENLASLNSLEFIANNYSKYIFQDIDIFEAFDELKRFTFEDAVALAKVLMRAQTTINIIEK